MKKPIVQQLISLGFYLVLEFLRPMTAYADSPPATIDYIPLTEVIPNPERGFYHYLETFSTKHTPLDVTTLQSYRQKENISLILRQYYLDSFVKTNITPQYLDLIQQDLEVVRQAGFKAVLRFAYSQTEVSPNNNDASFRQVLQHLDDLAAVIKDNSDVIAVVQAGFIGAYGEWYYAHPDFGVPGNPNYANRKAVLDKLLKVLPTDRMVQVRTPYYKQNLYGTGTGADSALPPDRAYDGTRIARTGHHNDCFLASEDDVGTYLDLVNDKAYLAAETQYLPMSGESCQPNPPRSQCATALDELERFHWSYLNADYHPGVVNGWTGGGCIEEIKRRLGYRFVLRQGTFTREVKPANGFEVTLRLQNEGWAAPFNPRSVELLLRNKADHTLYLAELPDDPRFWFAGPAAHVLSHTLGLPAGMPIGDYELLLNLPDPAPSLHHRPEYAIRLANEGVWEATTGYNNLGHTVTVSPTAMGQVYSGPLIFRPSGLTGGLIIRPAGRGLTVSPGGATTYQVGLPKAPTRPVTIRLTTDDQTEVSPASLTFNRTTWQTPQTVTLTAVENTGEAGPRTSLITHTFSSADPAYDGLAPVIVANVSDNKVYLPVILKN